MEKSFYDFEQYEKEGIVNIIIQSVITKKKTSKNTQRGWGFLLLYSNV